MLTALQMLHLLFLLKNTLILQMRARGVNRQEPYVNLKKYAA